MQLNRRLLQECWFAIIKLLRIKTYKNNVGRLGHGLVLQLTEPSHSFKNETKILEHGLTIEPGLEYLPGN